jgi:excisionase family DNA binding protein
VLNRRAMALDNPIVVLTVREVADYLRVHPSTVYKLLRTRQVPAFRIGSDWRFNKEKIDQWMADRTKPA